LGDHEELEFDEIHRLSSRPAAPNMLPGLDHEATKEMSDVLGSQPLNQPAIRRLFQTMRLITDAHDLGFQNQLPRFEQRNVAFQFILPLPAIPVQGAADLIE
jgi:hypothetical protein